MMSAVVIGGNVGVSRANPIQLASYGSAEDFVVLSLKNSSAIAARVPQESLSSRYDVVSKPIETMVPAPWLERPPALDPFGETLSLEAACQAGGRFDACPASLALLQGEPEEWSRDTDIALPDLSESQSVVASIGQEMSALTVGITAPAGRVDTTGPSIERMPVNSEVADAFTSQAACETGGLFDECPGFMDLLHGRQQAWPLLASGALPEMNELLTTASVRHAVVASASERVSLLTDDVVVPFDTPAVKAGEVILGTASMYNPYDKDDNDAGGAETASGELYNPIAWTAAIQIKLRAKFAGVRYGRLYKPSFALVELNGKRAIVKINDVGPLRPGRVIDFSTQVMHYFDPSLRLGILDGALVTPLIGSDWTPGPLGRTLAIAVASAGP
jgi:rare lipoprotein A